MKKSTARKKIVTVIGARPQFIKAVVVTRALQKISGVEEILVHTGQHYDENMSSIFFEEMGIPPASWMLNIRAELHGQQTGRMTEKIESVLLAEKPDWLLVYGDTNSTLAGALAAAKLHIPVAHVEAGLRSWNRSMPEEINRIVADQLSDLLFTPTSEAVINLKKEGFSSTRIRETGDVMYDVALLFSGIAAEKSKILSMLNLHDKTWLLATIHRAENTDNPERLSAIFSALDTLAMQHRIILPLHPRTKKCLEKYLPGLIQKTRITLIEPAGFLDMISLMKNAALILTDSGGVQKEAFFHRVPCVTLREETEWVETISLEWNRLANPFSTEDIIAAAELAIGSQGIENQHPYGNGHAAELIAQHLVEERC